MTRRRRLLLIAVIAYGVALIGTGVVFLFLVAGSSDDSTYAPGYVPRSIPYAADAPLPEREKPEDGRRETATAFDAPPVVGVDPQIDAVFRRIAESMRAGTDWFDADWDLVRTARELHRDRPPTASFGLLMNGLEKVIRANSIQARFDRTVVRSVRGVSGREIVVVVQHTDLRNGLVTGRRKARYWMTREWNNCEVHDYEDVSINVRESEAAAAILDAADGDEAELGRLLGELRALAKAQQASAPAMPGAPDPLADPRFDELPAPWTAVVYFWRAWRAMNAYRYDDVLTAVAALERVRPQAPAVAELRCRVHAAKGEHEAAVAEGRKCLQLAGRDPDVNLLVGQSLVALRRPDEAVVEFRSALDEAPESLMAMFGLVGALRGKPTDELIDRFRRMPTAVAALGSIIGALEDDDPIADLLITVAREKEPEAAEVEFQYARRLLRAKRTDEAVKAFLRAVDRAGDLRARYLGSFAVQMTQAGQATVAYAAWPGDDRRTAFREIAATFEDEEMTPEVVKQLEALIKVHRAKDADDPWLGFQQAMVHRFRKEFEQAEPLLADGMAKNLEGEDAGRFRRVRLDNLADAGRVGEAYVKVGPRRETFEHLADRLNRRAIDREGLAKLVWLHAWAEPNDPALTVWRGFAAFHRGDHRSAAAEFTEFLATRPATLRHYDDRARDALVRSLLRTGRREVARSALRGDGERWNVALDLAITASTGDVDATLKQLDEAKAGGKLNTIFLYMDADLGPLLRSPAFAKVREKYPPPADKQ